MGKPYPGQHWEECDTCQSEVEYERELYRIESLELSDETRAANEKERAEVAARLRKHRDEFGHQPIFEPPAE